MPVGTGREGGNSKLLVEQIPLWREEGMCRGVCWEGLEKCEIALEGVGGGL